MGLSSRCGCVTTHGDVVRNCNHHNNDAVLLLEGRAMAGLVAILRQLGDLAELAAEVFDDMQDQVMAASARARRLAVRARRLLEADLDLPPATSTYSSAAALTITTSSSGGRLGLGGGGGTPPPMPRLVVQRIRRCRGPPRLSLLDKFDAAGEGACLKRYTDPSFFFRAHSARLEQGTLRLRAPHLLKSMSMETRPRFQTALYSEPPESAHTDSKSETETETDASEAPSPGFRHLKQQHRHRHRHRHRQAASAVSPFRTHQTVDRVQSSPQLNMEHPSPSELERTSSFEAWLAPDATCSGSSVSHVVTTSNADADAAPTPSSSTMLKANKVKGRVSSLPRKLFSNIKHHDGCSRSDPAGTSLRISQATAIGDQCSNSNSSTPETIGDSTCTTQEPLVLKRAGALPENSSSEDAKLDTTPPLPPIPPMQWLSERFHTGTRAASPKHRALWKKSLEVIEMMKAIRQAHSHSIQTSPVDREEPLVSNENTSAHVSHRDEMKCSESEETRHPQPFRVSEDAVQVSSQGIVLKAGESPVPAVLSDEAIRTQAQADTCFQQQGRQQFCSSGHSDEKPSGEHEDSDSSSNLQNESVFFSAVQELAKMSPPPSVPRPKYSLLDAGCHGRITLRNGPSLIHPSRNILDSRNVLIKQIKDIAVAGNPSFKLKPVCAASSPQSPVTGSPTNSKVATILQRADDIRQAHANNNEVESEERWSDDSE